MALYRELNPQDPVTQPGRLQAAFDQILATPWLDLMVAELDGEVVGTVYLNVVPNLTRDASPYAIVENVVVARHARRRGVGRAIVRFALELAWKRGCYKAMLQAGARNERAHRLYRDCGFDQDERFAFVARPHGAVRPPPSPAPRL
jgi:GNAT superfamily N-acetyltransferase